MVKVAIAGGSSAVAKAIISALAVTQKHELLLLSRKDAGNERSSYNITWVKADYRNLGHLVQILQGVHTVLSFIPTQSDPGNSIQKNLVNAAIQVGAKRFAPSEWATSTFDHIGWYAGKAEMREYLKEVNKEKKVIEYSLFQPGLFVDYLTYPFESPDGIRLNEVAIDFHNRRAIFLDGGEEKKITLTTSTDLANIVASAVEFEGEWPVVGGVKGSELTFTQVIALGEKIRGCSFKVEKLKAEDLKAGIVKSSWMPKVDHPVIPPDEAQKWAPIALSAVLLSFAAEAWNVSDEWNRLFPDYKFTDAGQFLEDVWRNKS